MYTLRLRGAFRESGKQVWHLKEGTRVYYVPFLYRFHTWSGSGILCESYSNPMGAGMANFRLSEVSGLVPVTGGSVVVLG